jgi:hypothetical protein
VIIWVQFLTYQARNPNGIALENAAPEGFVDEHQ